MKLKNVFAAVASAAVVFGASGAYAGDPFGDRPIHVAKHKHKNKHKGWGQKAAAPVPEPSSMLVFGAGLLVAAQFARRKR